VKDLILLHGALGHSKQFEPYEPFLSEHFRVHKLLFHGHGATKVPDAGLNMEQYTLQLQQYIEVHALKEVAIFGYSMGGYVALTYAMQPDSKAASVLTLATKLNWTPETVAKEIKMLDPDLISEKVPKYAAQLAALHGAEHWKQLLPAIAKLMTDLAEKPLLNNAQYRLLNLPVQMMVGDKDVMVSVAETLEATRNIPDSRLAVLPETKHPIDMVRPDLLIGLMKDFWKL
jgi:pimeloyl-ACP methyl ester carboxylesterase